MNGFLSNISPEFLKEISSDEEKCYEFLAYLKWDRGFVCRKCGNTNYCHGKKPFSRRCTRCKYDESPTAYTVFHNCRLPITEAFSIMISVLFYPEKTAYKIAQEQCIRKMTCWKLRKKIIDVYHKNGTIILK